MIAVLLHIDNLDVRYGVIQALHGVAMEVRRGEIVTLIGANGAGKTTLLRTISGLVRPSGGSIFFNPTPDGETPSRWFTGIPLHTLPAHRIVRAGVIHVPEGRQIFANLTVGENLLLGAYQERNRTEIQRRLDRCFNLFPVLRDRRQQRGGTLSGGEQQMLAIARALMGRPVLLLLDEPSLGLAPLVVRTIFQIIRDINATGTTIFLVEQNAHMALTVAHRAYVLQTGRIIKSDRAANLLEDPEVKKAYLGG